MKKILFFLAAVGWYSIGQAQEVFLPGTDDIPLMAQVQIVDEIVSFDTPAGQILVLKGKTDQEISAIKAYYAMALPALGWVGSGTTYRRNGDVFQVSFEGKPPEIMVQFNITLTNSAAH